VKLTSVDTEVHQTELPREHPSARPPLPWSLKSAFLICLAYANLCFYNAWQQLESRYYDFFLSPPEKVGPVLRYFFALLTDIALLALLLWGVYVWLSRTSTPHASRIVAVGFLGLLAVPLNLARTEIGLFSLVNPVPLVAVLVVGIAVIIWHRVLIRPLGVLLMLLWPLLFVQIIASAMHFISADGYTEPALAKRYSGVPAKRLIWVVFDEFDENLAFQGRPPGIRLPNLDSLKAVSLSASNVYRVQRSTRFAIPSLLLGQTVSQVDIAGPTGLRLTFKDGTSQSYPFKDDIFSIVRRRGVNIGVAGWYIPYCRLFHDSVTDCFWVPGESQLESISTSLDPPIIQSYLKTLDMFPRNLFERTPGVERLGFTWAPIGFAPIKTRAAHQIIEMDSVRQAALRFSTDAELGFVYLHFPIPHVYGIYNSATGHVEPGGTYLDNLQLVDKTIGELRSALEQAHLWDSTAVLVGSDHSLRHTEDPFRHARDPEAAIDFIPPGVEGYLVPFLLKLPSQQTPVHYEQPFNAVLTRELVLSILSGEISRPEQAAQWLDGNRSRVPVVSN
jgi:hypothetical protein